MRALSSRNMMINNFIDKIKLPFRKEKELYYSLYGIIGFYPHNINYYKQALMHRSVTRRNAKGRPSTTSASNSWATPFSMPS